MIGAASATSVVVRRSLGATAAVPGARVRAATTAAAPHAGVAGARARVRRVGAAATLDVDTAVGLAAVTLVAAAAVHASGVLHWAIVPIAICGALQAPLVVKWLRGTVDAFDPRALVAVLILHNTFVAPLLHLSWDWYTSTIVVPPDPWLWFGRLALVNVVALVALEVAYRCTRTIDVGARSARPFGASRRRLRVALALAALLAVAAQTYLLVLLGGFSGIVSAYEAGGEDLSGTGWTQMLAWPLFLIVLLAWITARRPRRIGTPAVIAVLTLFAVAHFSWAGLEGSRSSTLAGLLLATAYCHFFLRRLTARTLLALAAAAVVFAFVYGFYKAAGRAGVSDALAGGSDLAYAQRQTGRDLPVLLLADLARADIQMEVLWTMYDANTDYTPKYGATYLGAAVFIPRTVWPTRPYGTQEAYAELTRGSVGVAPGERPGSRVFGLTGETLLNFGWMAVPIAHALFGWLIGLTSRAVYTLRRDDGRLVLVPIAILLLATIYPGDLVNVVYTFFRDGIVLTACALCAVTRPATPRRRRR